MNQEQILFTMYDALCRLPISGARRAEAYRDALRGRTLGEMERSAAYYRLRTCEGGLYE